MFAGAGFLLDCAMCPALMVVLLRVEALLHRRCQRPCDLAIDRPKEGGQPAGDRDDDDCRPLSLPERRRLTTNQAAEVRSAPALLAFRLDSRATGNTRVTSSQKLWVFRAPRPCCRRGRISGVA